MKKIIFLSLLFLAGCMSESEDVQPVANYQPKKGSGNSTSIMSVCGTGEIVQSFYGSYSTPTPYNTDMTNSFWAHPHSGNDQIATYSSHLGFFNNTQNNVLRLYKGTTFIGTINPQTEKRIYFSHTGCVNEVIEYYTWRVQKQSGNDPVSQVILTNYVNTSGFTNGNPYGGGVCTWTFN